MLDPSIRQIYIDQLIPPEGYHLDQALATTFSMDLMSLLIAPISMTLRGYKLQGDVIKDPIVIMEALNRSTDRFLVFCQKGRIAIPSQDTFLYSYLERVVIEVQPPNPKGVFHPKMWLLRFEGDEKKNPVIYRLLCLSKNLTFDHSWDTVLVLEGRLHGWRKKNFGLNRPLSRFIASLPDLANKKVSKQNKETVLKMAEEVARVRFDPPNDFERICQFIPVGIPGYARFPKIQGHKRILVVSPFLSHRALEKLTSVGKDNLVISRTETFKGMSKKDRESIMENASFFILNEAAEKPENAESGYDGYSSMTEAEDLSGLHAKLIITENGTLARVFTGSANVTDAAFSGKNVEFVVALSGERRLVGIKQFLGDEDSKLSFASILFPYEDAQDKAEANELTIDLDKMLEQARQNLLKANFQIFIQPSASGTFNMILTNRTRDFSLPNRVTCSCYPITIRETNSIDFAELNKLGKIVFRNLAAEALTSFIAFKLIAEKSDEKASISFVFNLPVEGMPSGRDKFILQRILSDQGAFIRYLLLILETDALPDSGKVSGKKTGVGNGGREALLPLFEEMVRAYSRNPEKISRISKIIQDLKDVGKIYKVVPPGFEDIWRAFREVTSMER